METLGTGIPESSLDFSFGFNKACYSDRTLLLQIVDDAETDTKVPNQLHDDPLSYATAPPVKTIHVSSLILAARSLFFSKLFSNGMLESEQKLVTLRIKTLEEDSVMDLLKYVYSNHLPSTLDALLNLMLISDKFEVASCLRDCVALVQNMPMTCESASRYLDLPPSLLMSPTVQALIDAAKHFLVAHFKDFDRCKEETVDLSLAGMQAVLSSDDLQVISEGVVYSSVLKWAREHYPDLEERRRILKTHLLDLVRFPFMTIAELTEEVQTCNNIDPEFASQIVIRALSFKAQTPHQKCCLAANDVSRQFVGRAYKLRPAKLVEVESSNQHCIGFFRLTRNELTDIFPDEEDEIVSEIFHLGKLELVLNAGCILDKESNCHYFCLAFEAVGSTTTSFKVKYEIAGRRKGEEFMCWKEGRKTFTRQVRYGNVVRCEWTSLMGDNSTYLVNDVLLLRVVLTTEK